MEKNCQQMQCCQQRSTKCTLFQELHSKKVKFWKHAQFCTNDEKFRHIMVCLRIRSVLRSEHPPSFDRSCKLKAAILDWNSKKFSSPLICASLKVVSVLGVPVSQTVNSNRVVVEKTTQFSLKLFRVNCRFNIYFLLEVTYFACPYHKKCTCSGT